MSINIRPAQPNDRTAVTQLHIDLSRSAYAHILSAEYLAETLAAEKQALWIERLGSYPDPERLAVTVAERGETVIGFSCFLFDPYDLRGAYLHNLYVHQSAQRQGVARRLIGAGLDQFPQCPGAQGIYIKAFEENRPACSLYTQLGGSILERVVVTRSQNPPAALLVYAWPSPDALRSALNA